MSYSADWPIDNGTYFPPPYSINGLPPTLRHGLIPVAILALMSVGSTLCLISFIGWRLFRWKVHYRTFLGHNQYVVLVLNLLLADMQQSAAFLISFHWLHENQILAPSSACFAQGWLLHSGDVSSGFFVLAIALHTFYTAVHGGRLGNRTFALIVVGIWVFAYFLTGIGVGVHGDHYFTRAGAWCWVSPAYERDRLALHYIWVFLIQFGTILIYLMTFYQLRKKTSQLFQGHQVGHNAPNMATVQAVNRITKLMTLYPCVYVILTLPLSAGRMWSMAHHGESTSSAFACTAGALITSCGWVDSLLYTLTRRRLLRDTMPESSSGRRTAGGEWEVNELGSKGITHTRTVTVEGGQILDTIDEDAKLQRHSQGGQNYSGVTFERSPSPTGSVDPILSGKGVGGTSKTKVSVGLEQVMAEEDEDEHIAPLPTYSAPAPSYQRGRRGPPAY